MALARAYAIRRGWTAEEWDNPRGDQARVIEGIVRDFALAANSIASTPRRARASVAPQGDLLDADEALSTKLQADNLRLIVDEQLDDERWIAHSAVMSAIQNAER